MARKTRGRPIHGVVLVNKPGGASSNRVLQQVKRAFYAQKAGHTGALDPLATGMLPVCLGEATKFAQFLLDADKKYRVHARLGVRTDTSDADGDVVERSDVTITEEQLLEMLPEFRGAIEQIPSMFSALKYEGRPLYEYARKGIEVPRTARPVTIFSLELVEFDEDLAVMDVHCSKGTYIRTLVDDLGQLLGCGAHVEKLHRTAVADYPSSAMVSLETLMELTDGREAPDEFDYSELDSYLLPMETPVQNLPALQLDTLTANAFLHGQPLPANDGAEADLVRIYQQENAQFLGVAERKADKRLWPKRVVVFES